MSFDASRFTFDPWNDYLGVILQQGRVQLDSDWNEWVAQLSRRLKAGAADMMGTAAVPQTTPNGFKITAAGGQVTIGRGRMYVDGLLAENHGLRPQVYLGPQPFYLNHFALDKKFNLPSFIPPSNSQWDPVLDEWVGTQDLPYNQQPYYPQAPALNAGPYLIYLDVWQREVTYLQQSDMVDKAIGIDTTGRVQTVWQVKALPVAKGTVNCGTPDAAIPNWPAVTAPSAGRLSTGISAASSASGPEACMVPPQNGYTGMENQLYRVEIHQPGAPLAPGGSAGSGNATFKWSRDNATVATAVTSVVLSSAQTQLAVESLGRDEVLGFASGNWVEVTNDWRELNGLPGVLAQIPPGGVDESGPTVTLGLALTTAFPNEWTQAPNIRVQRWDQAGKVFQSDGKTVWWDIDATGKADIPVPTSGTALVLENGIQVTFNLDPSIPSGQFKALDYWNFAARTADGSVEGLVQAEPKGNHHHYARLSVLTLPGTATDCRILWPSGQEEGCACTVCVTPASHASGLMTIQAAVNQVKGAGGGTVCLGPGLYQLDPGGVTLTNAQSVRIEGQGWRTVLLASGAAFSIQASRDVVLNRFSVISQGTDGQAAISLSQGCVGVELEDLILMEEGLFSGTGLAAGASAGTPAASAGGPTAPAAAPPAPSSSTVSAIGLTGIVTNLWIKNNILLAPVGLSAQGTGLADKGYLLTLETDIEDNLFICQNEAVIFAGLCLHGGRTRLRGNTVIDCPNGAVTATGVMLSQSLFEVLDNSFLVGGTALTAGLDFKATGNQFFLYGSNQSDGIAVSEGLDPGGLVECVIVGNHLKGLNGNAVSLSVPMQKAIITGNSIENCGGGIVFENQASAQWSAIQDNRLYQVSLNANNPGAGQAAICLLNVGDLRVTGNWISGVGVQDTQGSLRAGIQLVSCQNAIVRDNQVMDIGPQGDFVGEAVGIDVRSPFDRLDVLGNQVRRDSNGTSLQSQSQWWALRVQPQQTLTYVAPKLQAFRMSDLNLVLFTATGAFVAPATSESVVVQGNRLEARGGAPAALINTTGECQFRDNDCLLAEPPAVITQPSTPPVFNFKYPPLRPLVLPTTQTLNVVKESPAISLLKLSPATLDAAKAEPSLLSATAQPVAANNVVQPKFTAAEMLAVNKTAATPGLAIQPGLGAGGTATGGGSTPSAGADLNVAVQLQASAVIANGNRVTVTGKATSMLLSVDPSKMVVSGNLTSTAIVAGAGLTPSTAQLPQNALAAPWNNLNVNG